MLVNLANGQQIDLPDYLAAMVLGGDNVLGDQQRYVPGAGWPQAPPPANDPAPPPDGGDTGDGGGGGGPAQGITPFTGTFAAPPRAPIPGAPQFTAPKFTQAAPFKSPSFGDVLNDEGYKFRLQQGNANLGSWAAGKHTLNDSQTGKAFLDYGQNAASQEYDKVWKRDFDAYNTNYQTQNVDPYRFAYQGAMDEFTPKMDEWRFNANATQQNNTADYDHAWNEFQDQYKRWRDQNVNIPLELMG